MRKSLGRFVSVGAGLLLLTGMAGVASAEPGEFEPDDPSTRDIGVHVKCRPQGTLSMTADDADIMLDEVTDGVTAGQRWFGGSLGEVTVADDRCGTDIPDGVSWWVEGTATDFVAQDGQTNDIPADHLGWKPALVEGYMAEAGDWIDSTLGDEGWDQRGLSGRELLVFVGGTGSKDEEVLPENEWTVDAELLLKTYDTVEPGRYKSQLVLTLVEE